jgi:ABC-type lipoprotein release transport system permease subunit
VIVIDDVFARTFFPGEDPIGKHIHLATFGVQAQIVGITAHVKQWGLDGSAPWAVAAQFYYPFRQAPDNITRLAATGISVIIRTKGDPAQAAAPIRRAVAEVRPGAVVYNVITMDDVVANSYAARRFSMILFGVFAALALVLACIGIYGVISFLVGQRTHEIGLRMALGAEGADVLRMVLGSGTRVALTGVVVGVLAGLGLTQFMAHELFGVSAHDPATFGGVAAVLLVVAVAACYVPARRAVNVDPIVALRHE